MTIISLEKLTKFATKYYFLSKIYTSICKKYNIKLCELFFNGGMLFQII